MHPKKKEGVHLMAQCAFIKPNGTKCKGTPKEGQQWCWNHDPETLEARRTLGRKGGKRAGRGRPLAVIHDVIDRLDDLAEGVLNKKLARGDAAIVSRIMNVKIAAIRVGLQAKEQEELEARLEQVEAFLEQRRDRSA